MSFLTPLLDAINAGMNPQQKEIEGTQHVLHHKDIKITGIKPYAKLTPIELSSLNGLVDYIANDPDGLISETSNKILVVVYSPTFINCYLSLNNDDIREKFLEVDAIQPGMQTFDFNAWKDYERFIIDAVGNFQHDEEFKEFIRLISTVTIKDGGTIQDNGMSQTATMQKGVTHEVGELPSFLNLQPYRTFREVHQPISQFIYRTRQNPRTQEIESMLIEADGGGWRLEAIENIVSFLNAAIKAENVHVIR